MIFKDIRCPECDKMLLFKVESSSKCEIEIKCKSCKKIIGVDYSPEKTVFTVKKT